MLTTIAFHQILVKPLHLSSYDLSGDNVMTITSDADYKIDTFNKIIEKNVQKIIISSSASVKTFNGFNCITELEIQSSSSTEIPEKMFFGSSFIQKVTLPSNIKSIKDYAFAFSSISDINLAAITSIGNNAFEGCHKLTSISFDQDPEFGEYAFSGSGITSIRLKNCPQFLCSNCLSLTEITVLQTCIAIESNAFAYCTQLSTLNFEAGITMLSISEFA